MQWTRSVIFQVKLNVAQLRQKTPNFHLHVDLMTRTNNLPTSPGDICVYSRLGFGTDLATVGLFSLAR